MEPKNDLMRMIAAVLAQEAEKKKKPAKKKVVVEEEEEEISGVRIVDETKKPKKEKKVKVERAASPETTDIKKPSKALALSPRPNVRPMPHKCNCVFC